MDRKFHVRRQHGHDTKQISFLFLSKTDRRQMITTVMHFLLLMMENPAIMRRAREEIDAVVGDERLPTFSDRPALPYIEAIMSEVLRWSAAVPLSCVLSLDIWLGSFRLTSLFSRLRAGLPHRLMEDDLYKGMYLPKGSLVRAVISMSSLNLTSIADL